MVISASIKTALQSAADRIGVPAQWLYSQVRAESGFNPMAENPKTHAKGIIQFMEKTAKALGYKDQFDLVNKNPTVEQQLLGPVVAYYKMFKVSFPSEQSFYMTTFYPELRDAAPDTLFPPKVQLQNPGIFKVSDYVAFVKNKGQSGAVKMVAGLSLLAIGLYALTGYILVKIFSK